MKKILHIVEAFGGGVFTFLVDLINSTAKDYEIVLACSIRTQTPPNYRSYLDKNVKVIELVNGKRNINIKQDFKFYIEIKNIIKSENPDIIHLHSSKAGFLGRMATSDKKMKIFYNPHGYSFLKQDEKPWKKGMYKLIELIASKKSGYIVACSEGEYREALKLSKRAYLINNGIDTDKLIKYSEKKIDVKNLKICTVGRIDFQKNPAEFNLIAENFPNIKFTWIGEGILRDKLISKNISITGWLTKQEAIKVMNESDIFILTSLWEGLPIALLEAMFYKKICIVSNSIGNKDVINNGVNGFIAKDLDEFVKVINEIIKSNVDLNKIKENAYKDIKEIYNFHVVSEKYKKLYEN